MVIIRNKRVFQVCTLSTRQNAGQAGSVMVASEESGGTTALEECAIKVYS